MSKSIHCYDLPFRLKQVLIEHGFTLSGDLFDLSAEQINNITHLPLDDCELILREVKEEIPLYDTNGQALLEHEMSFDGSIFTFSVKLNELLEDGFPVGRLIEVAGESGSGKTQLCLQLCVNVQVPKEMVGIDGEAIFIDTENAYRAKRMYEIAINIVNQLKKSEDYHEEEFNVEKVLDRILIEQCHDLTHLRGVIGKKLDALLEKRPQVRLIVVDSIAYLLRYDFQGGPVLRDSILWEMSIKLKEIAMKHHVCVVLTNHVSYDPRVDKTQASFHDRWGHFFGFRLHLKKLDNNKRSATLIKSLNKPQRTVLYKIGPLGIEDVDEASLD